AVRHRPRLLPSRGLLDVQLEIPLARARHVDDQRQGLLEEGLERVLLAERGEAPIELALAARAGQLVARREVAHGAGGYHCAVPGVESPQRCLDAVSSQKHPSSSIRASGTAPNGERANRPRASSAVSPLANTRG